MRAFDGDRSSNSRARRRLFAVSAMVAQLALVGSARVHGQELDRAPDGRSLFYAHCASCHGRSGTGDGPAATSMRRQPPDITGLALANGGVFPMERLRRIVDGRDVEAHGDRDMPVWGTAFKMMGAAPSEAAIRARIRSILDYLQAIQRQRG
jgi:mono/diheme cytochrome c family protein